MLGLGLFFGFIGMIGFFILGINIYIPIGYKKEPNYGLAGLCFFASFISALVFFGSMMTSMSNADQRFANVCVDEFGGRVEDGPWSAATKTTPQLCIKGDKEITQSVEDYIEKD